MTDIDITYRMGCIPVDNTPSFKAVILYDTGAYASLINRVVAAWIEEQAGKGKQQGGKKHG